MNGYMAGEKRKQAILDTGLALWREGGEQAVQARAIGNMLGITHSGVLYHHNNSVDALRRAVADYAVMRRDTKVIRQLITSEHPSVAGFTAETRRAWLLADTPD